MMPNRKVVLGDVRVAEGRAPEGVAYRVDPLVDLGQEVEVEALQGDRAQDHTVYAPIPPRMTMHRIRIEMLNEKLVGKMFL